MKRSRPKPQFRGHNTKLLELHELRIVSPEFPHDFHVVRISVSPLRAISVLVFDADREILHWSEIRSPRPPGQDCQVADFSPV